jgi:hypothetical protein
MKQPWATFPVLIGVAISLIWIRACSTTPELPELKIDRTMPDLELDACEVETYNDVLSLQIQQGEYRPFIGRDSTIKFHALVKGQLHSYEYETKNVFIMPQDGKDAVLVYWQQHLMGDKSSKRIRYVYIWSNNPDIRWK